MGLGLGLGSGPGSVLGLGLRLGAGLGLGSALTETAPRGNAWRCAATHAPSSSAALRLRSPAHHAARGMTSGSTRAMLTWLGFGFGFGFGLGIGFGLGLDPGDAHCSTQPARGLARPGGLVGGRLVHEARELPRRRAEAEEAVA